MRKMNFLMIALLTGFLCACNNSSDSNDGGGGGGKFPAKIPDSISQKPEQGQALNQAQKAMFIQMMTDSTVMTAPELIVPAANESAQQQQDREKRLNESSIATKEFAMTLRQRCAIQPGTERVEGQIKNPGDQATTYSSRSLSGGGCPVNWSMNDVGVTSLVSMDQQSGQVVANFESNQQNTFKLVDAGLANKVQIAEFATNNQAIGRMEFLQWSMNSYVIFNMNAAGKTVNGEAVTVKGSGEFLIKGNTQNSKMTMYYGYQGVQFVLTMIQISKESGKSESQVYLNGELLAPGVLKVTPVRIMLPQQ